MTANQKIVLSSSHDHGWASEYPREFQEFFLMHPDVIKLVEDCDWQTLKFMVTGYWERARVYAYPDYPVCIDAIPNLKIHEVPHGAQFILNEVPYENIVLLNNHNVITAKY